MFAKAWLRLSVVLSMLCHDYSEVSAFIYEESLLTYTAFTESRIREGMTAIAPLSLLHRYITSIVSHWLSVLQMICNMHCFIHVYISEESLLLLPTNEPSSRHLLSAKAWLESLYLLLSLCCITSIVESQCT
jgi:hypothetical protein